MCNEVSYVHHFNYCQWPIPRIPSIQNECFLIHSTSSNLGFCSLLQLKIILTLSGYVKELLTPAVADSVGGVKIVLQG